ncbi:MAG: PolC-type DNA polymerase III [Clostridiales bacterium]|nr:PolC-type DNA polymerase III [Clostridiales bacterium]
MSEQEYINIGNKLLKNSAFSITHASRSSSTGAFHICLKAEKILMPFEIEAIKRFICDKLLTNNVSFEIDFKEAVDGLSDMREDDVADLFREIWSRISPEIFPVLANSLIDVSRDEDGTVFIVRSSPELIKAIDAESVSKIKTEAANNWDWHFGIKLVGDQDLNDIKSYDVSPYVVRERVSTADIGSAEPAPTKRKKPSAKAAVDPKDIVLGKEIVRREITPMSDFSETTGSAIAKGAIIGYEVSETRDKSRSIFKIDFSDKTNSLSAKFFTEPDKAGSIESLLKEIKDKGDEIIVRGSYKYDSYSRDYILMANDVNRCAREKRIDDAPDGEKRVELHLHTQSSTMDALTKVSDVVNTAFKWGHRAVAITDHGVVHSLPEAMKIYKDIKKTARANGVDPDFKVIFGCEGYLVSDSTIHSIDERPYTAVAVTAAYSAAGTAVYEIRAVKFDHEGTVIGEFGSVTDPGASLPKWAAEKCGIDEDEFKNAPEAIKVVGDFVSFAEGSVIVAYNDTVINGLSSVLASEDILPFEYVDINKLELNMHLNIKDYSMESGCAPISGRYEALPEIPAKDSVRALKELAAGLIAELKQNGGTEIPYWDRREPDYTKLQRYHIILLAASHEGLKNLYKLVSYSHLQYYHKRPCIPRSLLNMLRNGILLGSACEAGELYRAVSRGLPAEEQKRIAKWYDYLEIQPLDNNMFMTASDELNVSVDDLKNFNRRIVELGDELGKLTVATCDVHFLEPDDAIFRSILLHSQGYRDAVRMTPLYFRTTKEMLDEFSYLGEERAREVVITNPNIIADMCGEQLHPFLDEKFTYSPELPNAKEILESMTMNEAHRRYGDPLPEIVQKRLDKELASIVGNGYSSLYMVAQKLVSKSLGDGYLVGSRGSVGSSFVATMLGITEVNALPPHYLCPNCKYSEFKTDVHSRCGIDLPDKDCPVCGTKLRKEGYDIPFEVFLGFKGDKTPDIDLNFSGDYQPVAHRFTEEMFGAGHAFRAGTISAVQDKTVYGYVKHYCEDLGLNKSETEINRLVQGCLGVKKTSGQHPGGIVIVPEDYEIFDFCPVQHPADKNDSGSVTTHFDFHALDDKLVKLDILGHDDPTVLRMLNDLTGLDPRTIPLDDPETMSIYSTDAALGVSLKPLGCDVGSLAIPEFGTGFVRGMLTETRPTTMEELVRISGLSHGTDVWNNNAQVLVQNKVATLMEVICTRDDIMNYLISIGGDPSLSFKTMESVRKGRGLKPEMEEMMHSISVPEWFIDSCKKIKYMFPRAHAAAYVMMSFRIAYYKVHYPLEFYAVYFTVRADTFDIELCLGGFDAVMNNLKALKSKDKPDQKEKDAITILEVVAEMNLRGFELLPVDLYKSKAKNFTIEDGKLRPPFTSVAGLGENVAVQIENGAKGGEYSSKEDFAIRTKANSSIIEKLAALGCFEGIPDTDQIKFSF